MRWAIIDARGFRVVRGNTDRAEAIAHLRNLRAKAPPSVRYRLVRLVTRSERLQRDLDAAREALEQERRSHARYAQVERAAAEERQRIVEALRRCARGTLPPEIAEAVKRHGFGGQTVSVTAWAMKIACVLAGWVARGCP